jgi:Domain of unknown function (DUF3854)
VKNTLTASHQNELILSAIDPDIAVLNFVSIDQTEAFEFLIKNPSRRNDGRLTDRYLRIYNRLEAGGWICTGIDPLTMTPSEWGCLKPNDPRWDEAKRKHIKYEHPHGTPTELFCPRISYKNGLKIAKHNGLGDIYAERIISQSRAGTQAGEASCDGSYSSDDRELKESWNQCNCHSDRRGMSTDNAAGGQREVSGIYEDYLDAEDLGLWQWVIETNTAITIVEEGKKAAAFDGQRLPNNVSSIGQEETFGITEDDLNQVDTGFWQWIIETNIAITIVEGAKKAAALLSAGYVAIGLPGIFGGYRSKIDGVDAPQYLIPQLKVFTQQEREFSICFDNDTNPKTIATVRTAIDKTGKLLERKRCQVSVVSWQQPYKGVDDLIYNLGEETYHQTFTERQSLDSWRLSDDFDISQLPQTTVDTRYLDPSVRPDELAGKIVAIKSAKGTGKTKGYIADLIAPELDKGRSVLVISHRIQLAKALALDLGVNHISQVKTSEIGSLQGYSLCIDSLHPTSQAKFNPNAWENTIVVIDECEQVLWHMLNSVTCQRSRVAILQSFQELMRTVAESGGTVILSDADLSLVSIEYVRGLTDRYLDLWLLNNTHNPNQGKRSLTVHNSPAELLAAAQTDIMDGKRVMIHCSAQKTKSKWSSQNIETALAAQYPDQKILRIDAETVADPSHAAYGCIDRLNEVVVGYDIVVASPTIETGISIDVLHFDSVWALVNGVQTVDAVCQTLERVRADVPRHICITIGGITKVGNGSDSIRYLARSEHTQFKANYQAISRIDLSESTDGSSSSHLQTWAKYAAKVNQGYNKYASQIVDKLVGEGYELVTSQTDDEDLSIFTEIVENAIEAAKSSNYATEREGKMNAPNPHDVEFAALKKKTAKTKEERNRESKGTLVRRYLTEDITDDLIIKDDNGWYPQLQLHYYLTVGNKYLKQRDNARLDLLAPDGQQPFKPDGNRSCLSAKVRALQALQVEQFFGEDRTFTDDSLREWHERLLSCRLQVKEILGISISPTSHPVRAAQQILGKLGCKLLYLDRVRDNGELVRRYSGVDSSLDGRLDIFGRWLIRDDLVTEMNDCSTTTIDLTFSDMWNGGASSNAA